MKTVSKPRDLFTKGKREKARNGNTCLYQNPQKCKRRKKSLLSEKKRQVKQTWICNFTRDACCNSDENKTVPDWRNHEQQRRSQNKVHKKKSSESMNLIKDRRFNDEKNIGRKKSRGKNSLMSFNHQNKTLIIAPFRTSPNAAANEIRQPSSDEYDQGDYLRRFQNEFRPTL